MLEPAGSCIRDITSFQLNLYHGFCDYYSCSQLRPADKTQILPWEYNFKQPSLHCLYKNYSSWKCQIITWFSGYLVIFLILFLYISHKCNILITITNVTLEYSSFHLNNQGSFVRNFHKVWSLWLIIYGYSTARILPLFPSMWQNMDICQLKYLIYVLLCIIKFYVCEHKHREFPLHFRLLKTLPRKDCSQRYLVIRSPSTPYSRTISCNFWYSGQARTLFTKFCGKE